jgi:osmotically-inducible protein OsmY
MSPIPRKTDSDLQQDVLSELAWDTRVSPKDVGVLAKHGVVTLIGTVDSWSKAHAAEQAAHRVAGVYDVANELVVKLPDDARRDDTEIALAVRRALEWDVRVPAERITSTVAGGTVTLEGTVLAGTERADAEAAIVNLLGVKRVVNHIVVAPSDEIELDKARAAVARALERHTEREVQRIALSAKSGAMEVSGVVQTPQERAVILAVLRGTRGVREVIDRLTVQPPVTAGAGS